MSSKRATIHIDGQAHEVAAGRNLLEVALELGLDLPYFCWHPALGAVGACRQCAVTQYKDAQDPSGRVVMACMTPCGDGTRVATQDAASREMRQAVIEWLMTNHPHDCPVCAEGGNCHLQDMTVMTGQAYRRYRHAKRTHRNQDLGPFVAHEMNRCIACYRCVRYYRDYAGGEDLDVFGAHNNVYFGRAESGTLESHFAGNLVEVCPTGVFTDKPYGADYTRKWDLQQAPSLCNHCAVGCNTYPGERYGRIKRIENRYNEAVNGYFLCDRGRYGLAYSNEAGRPRQARGPQGPLRPVAAIERLAGLLDGRVAAVVGDRVSCESLYALRALLGAERVFRAAGPAQLALEDAQLQLLRVAPQVADLPRIENADCALLLGEDLLHSGARLGLALRQMTRQRGFAAAAQAHVPTWQDQSVRLVAQQQRSPLHIATPARTGLDEVAATQTRATPRELARLGWAIAHALDPQQPAPAALEPALQQVAERIAADLRAAQRPLLLTGAACAEPALYAATAAIAQALVACGAEAPAVAAVPAAANSVGRALFGGAGLQDLAAQVEAGRIDSLIVLEHDLAADLGEAGLQRWREQLQQLAVFDALPGPTWEAATLALPVATIFEAEGTLVNYAGRAQRHFAVHPPAGDARASWIWLCGVAEARGQSLGPTLDALLQGLAEAEPALAGLRDAAPAADAGGLNAVPRQPHRYSGRTAMHAHQDMHEPRPPIDLDTALGYTMEGAQGPGRDTPPALRTAHWAPGWNSPQAINKFQQEIGGALRGGPAGCLLPLAEGSRAAAQTLGAGPPEAEDTLRLLPLPDLFADDALAGRSPAIQARQQGGAALRLHPRTAERLGLATASRVRIEVDGEQRERPLTLCADLAAQCVGANLARCGLPAAWAGRPVRLRAEGGA